MIVIVKSSRTMVSSSTNGKWSANTEVNNRGVLRGVNKVKGEPCIGTVTRWKYWAEDRWKHGNITTTCGHNEYGMEASKIWKLEKIDVNTIFRSRLQV